ncbi:hypothetical protein [Thalassoglobus sp.]|uniref:hypothetical protein n=1 Tax=Thalassoglobus sp. TaxID=2795869 RepID=UPI003AA98149
MKFITEKPQSLFQEIDVTTIALILIAVGLISLSWPTSLFVMLLGILVAPLWLIWRVFDHTANRMI